MEGRVLHHFRTVDADRDAAMVIAGFAWRSPSRTIAWTLSSIAMAGVGLSLATSGHAATAPPQWLSRPLVFVHGVGVAYWVGALAPLAAMARRRSSDRCGLALVLDRSGVGGRAGGADRSHAGGHPTAKFQRAGRYKLRDHLLVKLALVIVLLGFAALNRYVVTPALSADPGDTHPLFGSVLVELVLVIAILAAVAGWRFTPPPRALQLQHSRRLRSTFTPMPRCSRC